MGERVYLVIELKNGKSGIPKIKTTNLAYMKSKRMITSMKLRHLEWDSFVQMTGCKGSQAY